MSTTSGATVLHRLGRRLLALPRGGAWTVCLAWYGLITLLSSRHGSAEPAHWTMRVLSNGFHAPLFGLMAAWISLLVPRRDGWPDLTGRVRIAILAVIVALGVTDELHQSLTPGRDLSALDLLTDVVGAWATLAVVAGLARAERPILTHLAAAAAASLAAGACATFVPRCFPSVAWF